MKAKAKLRAEIKGALDEILDDICLLLKEKIGAGRLKGVVPNEYKHVWLMEKIGLVCKTKLFQGPSSQYNFTRKALGLYEQLKKEEYH